MSANDALTIFASYSEIYNAYYTFDTELFLLLHNSIYKSQGMYELFTQVSVCDNVCENLHNIEHVYSPDTIEHRRGDDHKVISLYTCCLINFIMNFIYLFIGIYLYGFLAFLDILGG